MHRFVKRLRNTEGQVLAISALSFSILLGFAALAVDTGVLYRAKREMQTAADAAAVAGALDYLYKADATSAKTVGQTAASADGFTDGASGIKVDVWTPPVDGPNKGNTNFTEAVVSQPVGTFFMGMFGKNTMTVGARSVAGVPTAGQACIWLMANSGTALSLQGSYNVSAIGCGIYVNSPDSGALNVTGNGGTLTAKFLDVVGNKSGNHTTAPTAPTLNAAPRKNPFGNITGPTPSNGQCTTVDNTTTSLTGNIAGPGFGKSICYTKAVTMSGATLGTGSVTTNASGTQVLSTTTPAGTFVFENGLTVSGTDTVYGGTIDVYSGTFNQNSNSVLSISAPTSGTYNGIALMQPSTNSSTLQVQFGSNNQILDGYIYAPGAAVSLHDSGGGVTTSGIVALSMSNQTSQLTIPSYDVAHQSTTPNRIITIVE
jgi:Flp pilus assembly protein TadG